METEDDPTHPPKDWHYNPNLTDTAEYERNWTEVKKLFWTLPIIIFVSCSQINVPTAEVYFYGDSHVKNWDLDYWFPFNNNVNYGIPGYKVSDMANSIDETGPADKRVVWIGINDIIQLSQAYDRHTIIDSVLKSFRLLTEALGNDVLILSLCPVASGFDDQYLQDLNVIVYDVNAGLNTLCSVKQLQFIDISQSLYEDKSLKDVFTQDGLHLNNLGYEAVSKTLRPFLY